MGERRKDALVQSHFLLRALADCVWQIEEWDRGNLGFILEDVFLAAECNLWDAWHWMARVWRGEELGRSDALMRVEH